jgi:6-phosphofructokinase 1
MIVEILCSHLEHAFNREKLSAIVVVAAKEEPGVTFEIAEEVHRVLGLETRVCILGRIQRGGSPTARARVLASKLGTAAVKALWEAKEGYMVGEMKGKMIHVPFKDTWEKVKGMDPELEEPASLPCE